MHKTPETINEVLNLVIATQNLFFRVLKIDPELADHIFDLRTVRWNGDHGAVWWKDGDGRKQEVRVRESRNYEGLYLVHGTSLDDRGWYVFNMAREDASLEY